MAGWDADARLTRVSLYYDNGGFEEFTLNRREGSAFLGTFRSRAPGRPVLSGPVRVDFKDKGSINMSFLDGRPLSSWVRVAK